MPAKKSKTTGKNIRRIAGYEILSKLGQGAMGAVFKARQTSLDRIVALKLLPPAIAKDTVFIERFQREARTSAKLDHPHIVAGIDVGQDPATKVWYFAMEYVDGPTLNHELKKRGTFSEADALKVARQMTEALVCAQKHGIVHRDIKPDNILLTSRGEAKLADLGLAKQTSGAGQDASLTQDGKAVGTPFYMAPEQVRGEQNLIDIRTDLYALGATLFHLVTGRAPFEGNSGAVIMVKHLNDKAPLAHRLNPKISEGFSRLIDRLLQKDQGQRYASPTKLLEALEQLGQGNFPPPPKSHTTGPRAAVNSRTTGRHATKRSHTTGPRAPIKSHTTGPRAPIGSRDRDRTPGEHAAPGHTMLYAAAGGGALLLLAGLFFAFGGKSQPRTARGNNPIKKNKRNNSSSRKNSTHKNPSSAPSSLPPKSAVAADPLRANDVKKETMKVAAAQRSVALEKAWTELKERSQAARSATTGIDDYDAALRILNERKQGTESFSATLSERAKKQAAALHEEAISKIEANLEAAQRLLEEANPSKSLDMLKSVAKVRYAPLADKIATMKKRAEDKRAHVSDQKNKDEILAAEKKFNSYLARFDVAVLKENDWDAAGIIAKKVETEFSTARTPLKEQATALHPMVDAAAEVQKHALAALTKLIGKTIELETKRGKEKGTILKIKGGVIYWSIKVGGGTVEQQVKLPDLTVTSRANVLGKTYTPTTDAQKAALALERIRSKDLVGAENLFLQAEAFPLTPHYRKYIRKLQIGAAEVVAEEAWAAFSKMLPKSIKREAAKGLTKKLNQYVSVHGKTKFAEALKEKISALRYRIALTQEVRNYTAVWTKKEPTVLGPDGQPSNIVHPKRGKTTWPINFSSGGAAYDSKRKRCIFYGGGAYNGFQNGLWTYDPQQDVWQCVLPHDAKSSNRPPPYFAGGSTSLNFCYDSDRDLFWLIADKDLWSYTPEEKKWKKHPSFVREHKVNGLGYYPGFKKLVTLAGFINLDSGKIDPSIPQKFELAYAWQPSSALSSGGFALPNGKGEFLFYGGRKKIEAKTILFNPAKSLWTQLEPKQSPGNRSHSLVSYHPALKIWVLFGGRGIKDTLVDTWVYAPHLKDWIPLETSTAPSASIGGALWYDAPRRQFIFFSGSRYGNDAETWTLKLAPKFDGVGIATTLTPPVKPTSTASNAQPTLGLKGTYYAGENFEKVAMERTDRTINFQWRVGSPSPKMYYTQKHYSIRWTGKLKAPKPGRYTLLTYANDGARLWLDGKLLIDDWKGGGSPKRQQADVQLSAKAHTLKLEYLQSLGQSSFRFRWSQQGGFEEQTVPAEALSHIPKSPTTTGAAAKLKNIQRLFNGKVLSFNPATRAIVLDYDFETPRQALDFSGIVTKFKKGGHPKIRGGKLILLHSSGDMLLKGKFTSVSAQVEFKVTLQKGRVKITVCDDGKGSHYYMQAVNSHGGARMAKHVAGNHGAVKGGGGRPSPAAKSKQGTVSLSYRNGVLRGQVGDLNFTGKDQSHSLGSISLGGSGSELIFDNLHIRGVLQKEWLDQALKKK